MRRPWTGSRCAGRLVTEDGGLTSSDVIEIGSDALCVAAMEYRAHVVLERAGDDEKREPRAQAGE
ncbi:hypothetical protein [Streptomyces sp. NPDC001020]